MKNALMKTGSAALLVLFIAQCTKVSEENNVHPDGWIVKSSENFHGTKVKSGGIASCKTCHGEDYLGGELGISCYGCHAGGPSGHPADSIWVNVLQVGTDGFHGTSVADNGPANCSTCHGSDYYGGFSGASCFTCHAGGPSGHPADSLWVNDPDNSQFHGAIVAASLGPDDCARCHGDDYLGGTSSKSCDTCHGGGPSGHPASSEWLTQGSSNYHGENFWDNGWDFTDCKTCHGGNLEGAWGPNCGSCHTGSASELFTCYTCHGDASSSNINPPFGIKGEDEVADRAVGAHVAHLSGGTYSEVIECAECHVIPDSWDADDHLGDDNRAEINFGTLATGNGTVVPEYDASTGTCSNVYCHGNFAYGAIEGNNTTMTWTDSDGLNCGSCHNLPPTGHGGPWTSASQCSQCHSEVVNLDGTIKNKSLHINGSNN